MNLSKENRLENVVKIICSDIHEIVSINENMLCNDHELWHELVCCVLSSQIKYEIAKEFTNQLIKKELIGDFSSRKLNSLETRVRDVLNKPILLENKNIVYRFPNIRAKHIANIHHSINKYGKSLSSIIYSFNDPFELREFLINEFSGIGPKQASMFIRNIGFSYELAILDKHVVNYMSVNNIHTDFGNLGKKEYLFAESVLVKYAKGIGYPVGFVDWAIWIVMRVARREGYI